MERDYNFLGDNILKSLSLSELLQDSIVVRPSADPLKLEIKKIIVDQECSGEKYLPSETFQSVYSSPITMAVRLENFAREKPSHCSSTKEWNDMSIITAAESLIHEMEEGFLNPKQPMNLCEWSALEPGFFAILNPLRGGKNNCITHHDLLILGISANDSDDNDKSDFFGEPYHPNLVKPLLYCREEIKLSCIYGFIKKRSLQKHLLKKYPTILRDERYKFHSRDAPSFGFLHILEKKDIYQDFKVSSMPLHGATKIFLSPTPNNLGPEVNFTDAGGFTALEIPPDLLQNGKTDIEIKNTEPKAQPLRAIDVIKKAFRWWQQPSHSQNIWPVRTEFKSQSNTRHLLLLTSTLLAMITFHAALLTSRCRFEEGNYYNTRKNSIFHINSYSNQIFIKFNSMAFFLSVALMMRLLNDLPFRPWLLVSVFSLIGAYICTIMSPEKPCSFSS